MKSTREERVVCCHALPVFHVLRSLGNSSSGAEEVQTAQINGSSIRRDAKVIKSIVLFDMDPNIVPAWERWYYEYHSPEVARRYGPWIARHESFVPHLQPGR